MGINTTRATDAAMAAAIPALWNTTVNSDNFFRSQYRQARTDLTLNAIKAAGALTSG